MAWNESKWYGMRPSGMNGSSGRSMFEWHGMRPSGMRWVQVVWNESK